MPPPNRPAEPRWFLRPSRYGFTLANGARGVRRPVQVIEGNYELMPGVCPWWDRTVRRAQ